MATIYLRGIDDSCVEAELKHAQDGGEDGQGQKRGSGSGHVFSAKSPRVTSAVRITARSFAERFVVVFSEIS